MKVYNNILPQTFKFHFLKILVKVKQYSSSWTWYSISDLQSVTYRIGSQCYLPPDTSEQPNRPVVNQVLSIVKM